MEKPKDSQYYKAYIQGYRDGVNDAHNGKDLENIDSDLAKLPVEAMEITTRACNCLTRAGYKSVSDILELDDFALITMRNLGPKTGSEIAHWLDNNGFRCTVWSKYL